MTTAVFRVKSGYQGHRRNLVVEIGASPGNVIHQGLSRISTQNPFKPNQATDHRAKTSCRWHCQNVNTLTHEGAGVQKRLYCLHLVFICGSWHFKQRKLRTGRDQLRKLAFQKCSSSSSFPLLSSLTRDNVVYIIIGTHIFTNYNCTIS